MRSTKFYVAMFLLFSLFATNCEATPSSGFLKEGTVLKYACLLKKKSIVGEGSVSVEVERTVHSPRRMGGQVVFPIKETANNIVSFLFYGEDSSGIYIYASQGPTAVEPEIVQGRQYVFKYPLKIGNSWNYSNNKGENIKYSIISEEDIIVAAGDFRCLKIYVTGKTDINGNIRDFNKYQWISSANGIVVKEYLEYTEQEYTYAPATVYTISTQLASVNKK